MGAMNGQSYAQAAMVENNAFGNITNDSGYGHDPAHKLHGQLQAPHANPSDENEIQAEDEKHASKSAEGKRELRVSFLLTPPPIA